MVDENAFQPNFQAFTGILDIFGSTPFNNVLCRNPGKNPEVSVVDAISETDKMNSKLETLHKKCSSYITSEKFHGLNRELSFTSMFRSTSTIFCDLDEIAKRHSFHCVSEVCTSNANILRAMKLSTSCGFKGNGNTIVQECTTQPTFRAKDSMESNAKKFKNNFPHNDVLSSEIFLRDKRLNKCMEKNLYYNIDVKNRQKFWSYKYQTEYTKPMAEKKFKKKEYKGKQINDPCPCQLFSYTCPCSDEKSLTGLAKNNKCIPAVDKVVSATGIIQDAKKKQIKHDAPRESKGTGVTKQELETVVQTAQKIDNSNIETNSQDSNKARKPKKLHKIICPNCKVNVEAISRTEEDESITAESLYASKELASTAAYNCSTSSRSNRQKTGDGDICLHEPRCELIPVCQILPADETYDSLRNGRKRTSEKTTPRIIRITKACRHHPPCTVVPSCQRANVLRNNCEFIPPCLHRPRCINLPLCVPLSKSINYDELMGKYINDKDTEECHYGSRCKLDSLCQESESKEHHYNCCSHAMNPCNHHKYNTSTYIISPKNTFLTSSPVSPDRISPTSTLSPCSISNKSCQFNCFQCQLDLVNTQGPADSNGIVYMRDVGCQFHNIQYSPIDSLVQYKSSSASFNNLNIKTNRYYSNIHTLRYEDKCTNAVLDQDCLSTDSALSGEIDYNCPSHGHGYYTKHQHNSGFQPKSAYVAAYAEMAVISSKVKDIKDVKLKRAKRRDVYPVKSRRNFLKGKCQKFFTVKRKSSKKVLKKKRSSDISNHFMSCISKASLCFKPNRLVDVKVS